MTTAAATRPPRSIPRLLAVFVAVIGLLAGLAGTASASTTPPTRSSSGVASFPVLETRDGVADIPTPVFVGSGRSITAGHVGQTCPRFLTITSASCVATESGGEAGTGAKGAPKPSPNFETPTNAPQNPPTQVKPGNNVRVMGPTEQYPDGYWVETNAGGQPIDPSTGKPPSNVTKAGSRARTHVPLPPK